MFSDYIYKWLDNALDIGIKEQDFWNMTLAEFDRYLESYKRTQKRKAQEKATMDYVLGELIGRSIARIYSSSATYPEIAEIYPTLFDSQEIEQKKAEKKAELSALRFKQFANFHNSKINKEVANVK